MAVFLSPLFQLLASVTGALTPFKGVAAIANHGIGNQSRRWLVGLQKKPLNIQETKLPFRDAGFKMRKLYKKNDDVLLYLAHPLVLAPDSLS